MVRDRFVSEPLDVHHLLSVFKQVQLLPAVQQVEQFVALDFVETELKLELRILLQLVEYL